MRRQQAVLMKHQVCQTSSHVISIVGLGTLIHAHIYPIHLTLCSDVIV